MKRFAIWAAAAFSLAMLVGTAHAEPEQDLRVAGARVIVKEDEALVWSTRFILARDATDGERSLGLVRLAVPLPEGETLSPRDGVTPVVEGGRIVALRIESRAVDGRIIDATFVQPGHVAHGPLGVPLADGLAVQIVETDMGGGSRLEIDRDRGLDRRVAQAARDEAVRLTAFTPQPSDTAVYLRGADVRAVGGLRGSVVTVGERAARMSIAVSVVFAAAIGALVVAWRRLRKSAAAERADAMLAAEIERL